MSDQVQTEELLIGLAVGSGRLCRMFQKSIDRGDITSASRQSNQVR